MHPARLTEAEFRKQVRIETARGPGPGGQHRNKTDTAVRATHEPTGVQCIAGERRSLKMNQSQAYARLRMKLAMLHREPLSSDQLDALGVYEPSALLRSRLQGGRLVVSPKHKDYPAILSEALDVLAACMDDVPQAARLLHLSTAQLIRFFRTTPAVLTDVNVRRKARGSRPYQ